MKLLYALLATSVLAQEAPPKKIDFSTALSALLDVSPELDKARAERDQAHVAALPLVLAPSPTLSAVAQKTWTQVPGTAASYGLQADLNLFRGGSDLSGVMAGVAQRDQAELHFESQRLEIEADAVKLLLVAIQRAQVLELAQARFTSQMSVLEVAKLRFSRGLIPNQEVERVTIESSQAASELKAAQARAAESAEDLKTRLGSIEIESRWPWMKDLSSQDLWKRLPPTETAVEDSPPMRDARRSVDASENLRAVKRGAFLPAVDVTSTWGRSGTSWTGSNLQLGWTLGLSLTWTLWDRLATYSEFRVAAASEAVARKDFEILRRDTGSQLVKTTKTLDLARQSALERSQIVEHSRALYEHSLGLFKEGRVNANELLLDEQRWQASRSSAVDGWAEAHAALLAYCKVRGRSMLSGCLAGK